MKFNLEYFEGLTDKELTDIAMIEASYIMGENEVLPECVEEMREQQADLYAALVNRIASYNPEIQHQVK